MRGIEDTSVLGVGLQSGVGQLGVGYLGVRGESLDTDGLSLDLQFALDKTLTARKGPTPTFLRASAATQVNAAGLIEYAPENLVLQSENFGTSWNNNTGNSLVLNDALSPVGTLTADRVDFPATATTGLIKQIQQNFAGAFAGSAVVSASVWLKTVSGTATVYLTLLDGGAPWIRSATACSVTDQWQRFSVSLSNPALSLFLSIGPDTRTTSGTPAQPPVQNAASVHIWGAQLERSSTARAYIPTTTAAVYGARFDHDPLTLACKGLLIEESRTNIVFPSDTLTTQTRTVTAVAHTLSFYGAGTVVLSGAHSATVIGTGAYPTRTTLTFTPTAGSLTLTVTGSVTQAQLEVGGFATSYIPTVTASVIRSADVCSISGSAFTTLWNPLEGSLFASGVGKNYLVMASGATNANQIAFLRNSSPKYMRWDVANNGNYTAQIIGQTITDETFVKSAGSYASNDARAAFNGTLGIQDLTVTIPSLTTLNIGSGSGGGQQFNGTVGAVRYFRKPLSNSKLQALTV